MTDASGARSDRVAARALSDKALASQQERLFAEAVSAYDELTSRFGNSDDPEVEYLWVVGLQNRGSALMSLGRHADALASYEQFGNVVADAKDPRLCAFVPWSLYDKANALGKLGRLSEALSGFDVVIARFAGAPNGASRGCAVESLTRKAELLNRTERVSEAIDSYEELITRFGDDDEPRIAWLVERAREALHRPVSSRVPGTDTAA